jgi:hypothetical protein
VKRKKKGGENGTPNVFRIVGENKQIIQRVVIHKSLLETEK